MIPSNFHWYSRKTIFTTRNAVLFCNIYIRYNSIRHVCTFRLPKQEEREITWKSRMWYCVSPDFSRNEAIDDAITIDTQNMSKLRREYSKWLQEVCRLMFVIFRVVTPFLWFYSYTPYSFFFLTSYIHVSLADYDDIRNLGIVLQITSTLIYFTRDLHDQFSSVLIYTCILMYDIFLVRVWHK